MPPDWHRGTRRCRPQSLRVRLRLGPVRAVATVFTKRHIDISYDDSFVIGDLLDVAVVLAIDGASSLAPGLSRAMKVVAPQHLQKRLPGT